jgi:hypothetical protein
MSKSGKSKSSKHSEDSESEEEDLIEEKFRYEKCGKSSIDNAIVAVSRWHARNSWSNKSEDWFDQVELVVAVVLYMIVLFVQAFLLIMFYRYWVEIKDDPYEHSWYSQMKLAVRNATLLNATLANASTEAAMTALTYCSLNRATPFLHFVCLWIWFGEGLSLVSESLWRFYLVWSFHEHHDEKDKHKSLVKDECLDPPPGERNVKVNIQVMNLQHKMFASIVILTPSLMLNLFVAWVGASYISVTTEINLLVKASLKMGFIARMDKLIYPCYVSYNWENYVANSNFKISDPFDGMAIFDTWVSTVSKALLGMVAGWWCCSIIWPNVEEYRLLCADYYKVNPQDNVFPGRVPIPISNVTDGWWYPDI